MNPKTKLELTWTGKDRRPRLEPRILLEDPAFSYHAEHRVTDNDLFDSRLIFGDNLLAVAGSRRRVGPRFEEVEKVGFSPSGFPGLTPHLSLVRVDLLRKSPGMEFQGF